MNGRLHFVGVAGSGMSSLALFAAQRGHPVSGSDREFDRGRLDATARALAAAGIRIVAQDGAGVADADRVVTSSAVEAAIPDLERARIAGLPILHRSELLAEFANCGPSVAVAGSSGKSTVTAMIFYALARLGRDPGLVTGAPLRDPAGGQGQSAVHGTGPLVFEADESDGTLVRYAPSVAVILNLHRDHMEPALVLEQYATLARRTRDGLAIAREAALSSLWDLGSTFGWDESAAVVARDFHGDGHRASFVWDGVRIEVPVPGRHNAENALAACAVLARLGHGPAEVREALATFPGVARRLESLGTVDGITVIDDYAHNPNKLAAAIQTVAATCARLHVFFQPHGFGPTRFHREALVATLCQVSRPGDTLHFGEIYDAGGTVRRDISSADLAEDAKARGRPATAGPREAFRREVARSARPGDRILILGARDPDLGTFARAVLDTLATERGRRSDRVEPERA